MSQQRLFDCFTFNRELDMLEFRLSYLNDVVDRFVLVEATRTHSGRAKPLYFAEHLDRYSRWDDKIVHVVVDDLPEPVSGNRWVPERYQRNAIVRGLAEACPEDVVLVMDVDEIPDVNVVARLRSATCEPVALEMVTAYFKANFIYRNHWLRPKAIPYEQLGEPNALRMGEPPPARINSAGAHLTYLASPAEIERKYRDFAHREFDNPRDRSRAHLDRCARYAVAQFGEGEVFTQVGRGELVGVLAAAYDFNPEWFDFRELPAEWRRRAMSRYSRWRRGRYPPDGLVDFLDAHFDGWSPALAPLLAAYEAAVIARSRVRVLRAGQRGRPQAE